MIVESARHQLDGRRRSRVLAVENRVHLDDFEGAREPGLGHELEREMRLTVGEAATHRRPNSGRDLGVERVHVEGDVDEAGSGDMVECLAHRSFDPDAIDLAHREDPDAGLAEQLALAHVCLP
jgi:hypothetical protein